MLYCVGSRGEKEGSSPPCSPEEAESPSLLKRLSPLVGVGRVGGGRVVEGRESSPLLPSVYIVCVCVGGGSNPDLCIN